MSKSIPHDWKEPAKNAASCLTIARFLASRLCSDDDEPEGLVPALVVALALFHSSSNPTATPAPDAPGIDEMEP